MMLKTPVFEVGIVLPEDPNPLLSELKGGLEVSAEVDVDPVLPSLVHLVEHEVGACLHAILFDPDLRTVVEALVEQVPADGDRLHLRVETFAPSGDEGITIRLLGAASSRRSRSPTSSAVRRVRGALSMARVDAARCWDGFRWRRASR